MPVSAGAETSGLVQPGPKQRDLFIKHVAKLEHALIVIVTHCKPGARLHFCDVASVLLPNLRICLNQSIVHDYQMPRVLNS